MLVGHLQTSVLISLWTNLLFSSSHFMLLIFATCFIFTLVELDSNYIKCLLLGEEKLYLSSCIDTIAQYKKNEAFIAYIFY